MSAGWEPFFAFAGMIAAIPVSYVLADLYMRLRRRF